MRATRGSGSQEPRDSVEWASGHLTIPRSDRPFEFKPVPAPPSGPPAAEEAERETGPGRRIGLGAALAVVGLAGVVAPMLSATAAHAAVLRDTTPVQAGNVQEVVSRFDAEHQLYVVGQPSVNGVRIEGAELQKLQSVLEKHPNVYVVLVDGSRNVADDDYDLSRGVVNSPAFQGVVNETTGERQGVVFMIYTNVQDQGFIEETGKDRAIYMRSEELPDRLGVGEENFASEDGAPLELMQLYIDSFKAGQGLPGSLDAVASRINQRIDQHVESTVGAAQAEVDRAAVALDGVTGKSEEFRRQHGEAGELGSPNLEGWRQQLAQARQAVQSRDYAGATRISQSLVASIQGYEASLDNFSRAPAVAAEVEALLARTAETMASLEDNSQAREA
ncbi:MAG: hypothetical protein AB1758_36595, partial [Candidatus Eremiobacterota bacterium]